jgi:hypothetical protein
MLDKSKQYTEVYLCTQLRLHTWVKGYVGTIMFMYKYVGELSKELGGSPQS